MISVDLSTRECDGHVIVALRGELDITDAVSVAAALVAAAARDPEIIVDLAGVEFIDCGGAAALARGRTQARHAGGDLRLAAAQQQVLRVLTLTRLIEVSPSMPASTRRPAAPAAPGRQLRQWPGVPSASPWQDLGRVAARRHAGQERESWIGEHHRPATAG
jgi:anti-sigma B factor antagonist